MAKPLPLTIHESLKTLKALQRKSSPLISNRLRILIEIKKRASSGGISQRELSAKTGINPKSISKWRKQYAECRPAELGLSALLSHGRKGSKKVLFPQQYTKHYPKNSMTLKMDFADMLNCSTGSIRPFLYLLNILP